MALSAEIKNMLGFDLDACWQVRLLKHTEGDWLGAVSLSILAHNYIEQMPFVLTVAFRWYHGPGTTMPYPALKSAARIAKTGAIVANVVDKQGHDLKDFVLFKTEIELRDAFRRVADHLKLDDQDRLELFRAVKNWVVADRRLDPTFDPKDPDAKRLVN